MAIFASLEGAIAHGRFDELRSFYGPESEAILNVDPSISTSGGDSTLHPAVGPDAISARAEELFGGKAVHFKLERLFSQRSLQDGWLVVANGRMHMETEEFPFTHTVVLAPANAEASAFYVRNEVMSVTGEGSNLVVLPKSSPSSSSSSSSSSSTTTTSSNNNNNTSSTTKAATSLPAAVPSEERTASGDATLTSSAVPEATASESLLDSAPSPTAMDGAMAPHDAAAALGGGMPEWGLHQEDVDAPAEESKEELAVTEAPAATDAAAGTGMAGLPPAVAQPSTPERVQVAPADSEVSAPAPAAMLPSPKAAADPPASGGLPSPTAVTLPPSQASSPSSRRKNRARGSRKPQSESAAPSGASQVTSSSPRAPAASSLPAPAVAAVPGSRAAASRDAPASAPPVSAVHVTVTHESRPSAAKILTVDNVSAALARFGAIKSINMDRLASSGFLVATFVRPAGAQAAATCSVATVSGVEIHMELRRPSNRGSRGAGSARTGAAADAASPSGGKKRRGGRSRQRRGAGGGRGGPKGETA